MRINEKSIILPALYIIHKNKTATTSELIKELTEFFKPTGEDAEILSGRKDTKFSQKVRNLVSHRGTNMMKVYTYFDEGIYSLTKEGKEYLSENKKVIEYILKNQFQYSDINSLTSRAVSAKGKNKRIIIYDESMMISEGEAIVKQSKVKHRCSKLREAVISKYTQINGRIYCSVCGFDFEEFYKELGRGFIEIHHEVPIYQYSDEGFSQYLLEAIKSMKPVCANCHRMLHRSKNKYISTKELKEIIGEEYDHRF